MQNTSVNGSEAREPGGERIEQNLNQATVSRDEGQTMVGPGEGRHRYSPGAYI